MLNQVRNILVTGAIAVLAFACNDNKEEPVPGQTYDDGVIVINGGNFFQNNGTLSFLKRNSTTVFENIFNVANNQASLPPADGRIEGYSEAGNIGIILFDNDAYGLDKLVFVDASTFEKKYELSAPNIENPRDIVVISNQKAYVTNWDAMNEDWTYKEGFITITDPETGTAGGKINVGQGPENMVRHQNKVYIGRAPFTSNELAIVDTGTDQLVKSISFESWPNPIGVDQNGKLWVKEGNRLHRINTSTDETEASIEVGNDITKSIGAATLTADKGHMIFVLSHSNEETNWKEIGDTYVFSTSASEINVDTPILRRVFTGLAADPVSNTIYGAVTPSLTQGGYVLRISPAGVLQDSVKVEISPEGFYFK